MEESVGKKFSCNSCGAALEFAPGLSKLKCPYCAAASEIGVSEDEVQELSLDEWLDKFASESETEVHTSITCAPCGAISNIENTSLSHCPFCGSQLMGNARPLRLMKPKSLLPFKIKQGEATEEYRRWINSLWFAPNKLKRFAENQATGIKGMYIPYWTFDSTSVTTYTGKRGKTYRDSRGSSQTNWTSVNGTVRNSFHNIPAPATKSLPVKLVEKLEPWDLEELTAYQDEFLSGFQSEAYSVDLRQGYTVGKAKMEEIIRSTIFSDIGGNEQRITTMNPVFTPFTFKHVLLPVWINSYRFGDRSFRYLVNGRTGEVQGERPWSAWKIAALVAVIVFIFGVIMYFYLSN